MCLYVFDIIHQEGEVSAKELIKIEYNKPIYIKESYAHYKKQPEIK